MQKKTNWAPALRRVLPALSLSLILVLASACMQPRATASAGPASDDGAAYLYACSQDGAAVYVIDMATNEVASVVDLKTLGFDETAKPHHVVVEPDGSYWYVSLIGANRVLKFNRANELVGNVAFERPGMLALDPTSEALFVGRSMAAVNPPQRIGIVDRATMEIDELDVFFPRPHALAYDPATSYLYTASLAENRIAVIDVEAEVVDLVSIDGPTNTFVQFAVSPDGGTMVVGGQLTGKLFVFDVTDPPALPLRRTIAVNAAPWHPVFSPDGRKVYFGNKMANTVTVVNVAAGTVEAVIEGEGIHQPHGSAVRPDGRYVYVSSNNLKGAMDHNHTANAASGDDRRPGTIAVIDTATNTVVKVIEIGPYASGLGAAMPAR